MGGSGEENQPNLGIEEVTELLAIARENPQLLEMLASDPQLKQLLELNPGLGQMLQNSAQEKAKPREEISRQNWIKKYPVHFEAERGSVINLRKAIFEGIAKSIFNIEANILEERGKENERNERSQFCNINQLEERHGLSPLHLASYDGHMMACQLLLQSGADINLESRDGFTPADYAHQEKKFEVAEFLTSRGECTRKGNFPFTKPV